MTGYLRLSLLSTNNLFINSKTYTYQPRCELFRYEDEVIDTGVSFVDDNVEEEGYIQELKLVGVGTTATAETTLVNGAIQQVFINQDGNGYTLPPRVVIGNPISAGTTASAVAIAATNGGLDAVQFINPGAIHKQSCHILLPNIYRWWCRCCCNSWCHL